MRGVKTRCVTFEDDEPRDYAYAAMSNLRINMHSVGIKYLLFSG